MDQLDHRIVALLRENARRSYQDIGGRVALSAPAIKRRVDRLERQGVIRGYSANIDPAAFGWHTHAFVELFCDGRVSGSEVSAAVAVHPEVEGAYTIAGAPSAILHVRAEDTAHLEDALERIRETPGVTRTQTQVVLSTLFERPIADGVPTQTRPSRGRARARDEVPVQASRPGPPGSRPNPPPPDAKRRRRR